MTEHRNVQNLLQESAQIPASETPTLHEEAIEPEPVDASLKEKRKEDPKPRETPSQGMQQSPDDPDIYIVDWDGPNDPQNPKK